MRLCPWSFLSLASRVSVIGKAVLGLGFFCVLGLGLEPRDVEAEAEAGSGSGGSGKFLWKRKRKLEAVNGYRFRFHLRCSTILALNVFLTQNKQLKHTITRVCEASCCRKYPLLNSQKFESTAVC